MLDNKAFSCSGGCVPGSASNVFDASPCSPYHCNKKYGLVPLARIPRAAWQLFAFLHWLHFTKWRPVREPALSLYKGGQHIWFDGWSSYAPYIGFRATVSDRPFPVSISVFDGIGRSEKSKRRPGRSRFHLKFGWQILIVSKHTLIHFQMVLLLRGETKLARPSPNPFQTGPSYPVCRMIKMQFDLVTMVSQAATNRCHTTLKPQDQARQRCPHLL